MTTRACPVGHPSAEGMKSCPLCGRKYVKESQVVLPPTKEQVMSEWRTKKRAARAAAAEAAALEAQETTEEPAIPAARESVEGTVDLTDRVSSWAQSLEVAPKLLSVGAAAMFVSAFALGESVMALNLIG